MEVLAIVVALTWQSFWWMLQKIVHSMKTFDEPEWRIEHNKKPKASMKSFNGLEKSALKG
jgi:hypothetical protein